MSFIPTGIALSVIQHMFGFIRLGSFSMETITFFCVPSFFQIKVDIPPECRIYPIDSEDEQESPGSARGGVKEIICPWESITK